MHEWQKENRYVEWDVDTKRTGLPYFLRGAPKPEVKSILCHVVGKLVAVKARTNHLQAVTEHESRYISYPMETILDQTKTT